jgi:hypothetical protein
MNQGLKYAIIWFGGIAALYFGLGAILGHRPPIGPSTGESCVAFVNRVFQETRQSRRSISDQEEIDLDLCREALRNP